MTPMPAQIAAEPIELSRRRPRLPLEMLVLIFTAFILSLVLGIALSFNLTRMRDAFAWVEHTNEVLRQLSAAERQLLEAKSSERGYLLSGETSYLENYHQAQALIPDLLSALRTLASDNPVQTGRIDQLRENIDARLGEFKQAIDFGPKRPQEFLEF